jgi:hypothetical protein
MSIQISEAQLCAIFAAANALHPADRDQFIAAVATELAGQAIIGDGSVGRAIRNAQARFAHPEPDPLPPRWARERPRFEKPSKRAF